VAFSERREKHFVPRALSEKPSGRGCARGGARNGNVSWRRRAQIKQLAWLMAERQIGHRKLALSAGFPVIKWRSSSFAKSACLLTLNQIIFYFYLFFLSVLGIPSGAEQKNLGERGDPNKALRRVKGRRTPFPHFPLSYLPITVSSRFLSGPSSKRRCCSSKAWFDPLKEYPVTSIHSQIVPLNSLIVPRYI